MPPPDVPPPVLDRQLLERYIQSKDEGAFAELVRRHLDLVHGAARRQAPQAADDITQAVFLLLAQKAARLPRNRPPAGWLCQATRFCCATLKRDEARRRHHEREAAVMAQVSTDDKTVQNMVPLLDESLAKLSGSERDAVVLRYLEGKSLAETGTELAITADAAAMRAGRGLEKLRAFFAKRGYIVPAAAVAGLLTAESAHAAPSALATKVVTLGTHGAVISAQTAAIAKGAMNMMTWIKVKLAAAVIGAVVITSGAGAVVVEKTLNQSGSPPGATVPRLSTGSIAQTAPTTQATNAATTQPAPAATAMAGGLDAQLDRVDGLRGGFNTPFDLVESQCNALLKKYTAPEDQAKIYFELAHVQGQSGLQRPEKTIEWIKKALDGPLPIEKRAQLYVYWGSALEVSHRGDNGEALKLARKEAAVPYLTGLKECLHFVEELQKTPLPVAPQIPPRQPRADNRAINATQHAASLRKQQIERIVGFENAYTDQLVYLYSRFPLATEELETLAGEILDDKAAAEKLMAQVRAEVQKRTQ